MKDVFVGILIIIIAFLIVDFIYTEKNTCVIQECSGCPITEEKCGIIKKQLNIDINLFNRYW